jgi:hypothetical protein
VRIVWVFSIVVPEVAERSSFLMPRIPKDDLEYCSKFKKCCDCYREEKDVQALRFQRRRKLQVPCCRKHFDDYVEKMRQARALKYARHCARRQKAGLCGYSGCQAKLIPPELLPHWRRGERTCGQHGTFKAFQINRIAVIQYIIDHCLTLEKRETAMLQNVIYKRGEGLAFIGIQYPNLYETHVGSASNLERRIKEIRSQEVFDTARSGAARQNTE